MEGLGGIMIKNYLKIAWRNLRINRLFSFINIGGLAIGMAVSFMLLIYVYNEFSFDKNNINAERLYKVMRSQPSNGEVLTGDATPVPLAPAIKKDFSEIDQVVRTTWSSDRLVNYKEKGLKLNSMAADPQFFKLFTCQFIYGDEKTALSDLSSVVLTESASKALFGDINPVGQVIKLDQAFPLKVTAVVKDNPQNSTFHFKLLINWDQMGAELNWVKTAAWGNYSFQTYAMLRPDASTTAVNAKLKNIVARYDPVNKENTIFLYPLLKYHLYSDFKNGVNVGGRVTTVKLFLWLAIGILFIACINFMNLSTARSERRAREVGVRKAIGAARSTLIAQFMGESLVMAFISLLFAVGFIALLIPVFRNVINVKLLVPYDNPVAWFAAIGVTIFTGLIAGSYPALFLSSFKPVKVLKGQLVQVRQVVNPRKALVVLQFTFAIGLILASIFIYKQIIFAKNRPIGYDRFGLIEMPVEGVMAKRFEDFRRDLINAGAITDGAMTGMSIVTNGSNSWGITWQGQLPGEDKIPIDQMAATYHFTGTFGVKLVEGRDFSREYPSDTAAIMLNQAAVKMMRFKEPLGQIVKYQGQNCKVVGVVENFTWGSPYEPVKAAIIGFNAGWIGNISLRLNPSKSISASLAIIQNIYKKYNPDYPLDYRFTDERYNEKFNNEKVLGNMAICFTCLAIIVSSLGLFGLASFSAEQRRKEIGIRKVLGATIGSIWVKLSQEFVVLVSISFVLGSLFSWWFMNSWMSQFTYKTGLSLWVFLVTLVLSLIVCMLTVSWQAIKAALMNPVKSLRSE
jgi:ABC-type antimicrobial peptide transport system permease subunit